MSAADKTRTVLGVIALVIATGVHAGTPDVEAAEKKLAADRDNPYLLSSVGDARFLHDDESAYQSYTLAWHYALKDAWGATKGDSAFWKVLAASVAVMGVATDVMNAQQGIQSNFSPAAITTSGQMMSTLEEATGNKDNRKNVRRVMGDIKTLTKRGTSSYRIIYPMDNRVAGAAMARVHAPNGVCNGVRVDTGNYAVSTSCLSKFGIPTGISINTTLKPGDFATVASVRAEGDQTIVEVVAIDGDISTTDWRPERSTNDKPDAWGVTWFASEFDFIVPLFESCTNGRFDDCGDVHNNNAILWVRQNGTWRFYGFATPDGRITSEHLGPAQ
jgi:hypothetical protein